MVLRPEAPGLVAANRSFHDQLVAGVEVEVRREDGGTGGEMVRLVDFDDPGSSDWLAVNQFTVVEAGHNRRPDIVVFVNGLPLAVIELKRPEEGQEWFPAAHNQIRTYKDQIPSLFHYNELVAVSDGMEARLGSAR